jgi:3-methyladenine DNA glycosylase AlkD
LKTVPEIGIENLFKEKLPEQISSKIVKTRKLASPTVDAVIEEIRRRGRPESLRGMARYWIRTDKAFGVSIPNLRGLAKTIGRDYELSAQLWKTGVHEARILAGMIDDPSKVTKSQMETWVGDFDSWDVVDGVCGNLLDKTLFDVSKAHEWSVRKEENVKRAGFVLMAELAVHDKNATNMTFLDFLPLVVGGNRRTTETT